MLKIIGSGAGVVKKKDTKRKHNRAKNAKIHVQSLRKESIPSTDTLKVDKSIFYNNSAEVPRRGLIDVSLRRVSELEVKYDLPPYISTKDREYPHKGPTLWGGFWETPTQEDKSYVLTLLHDCLTNDQNVRSEDYPFFSNLQHRENTKEPTFQELIAMSVRLVARYSGEHDDDHNVFSLQDVLAINPEEQKITTKCVVFNDAFMVVCKTLIEEFAPDLTKKVVFTISGYHLAPDIPRTAETIYKNPEDKLSVRHLRHGAIHIFTKDDSGIRVTAVDPYWIPREKAKEFTQADLDSLDRTFIRGHDDWLQILTLGQTTWVQLKETFFHNAKIMSTPSDNLQHALVWGKILELRIAAADQNQGAEVTASNPKPPSEYTIYPFEYFKRTYGPAATEKYRKALAEQKRHQNLALERIAFEQEWNSLGRNVRNHRDALVIQALSQVDVEYPLAVDHLVRIIEIDSMLSQSNYTVDSRVYESLVNLFRELNKGNRTINSLAVVDPMMRRALDKRLAMEVVVPPHNTDPAVRKQVYEFRLEMYKYWIKNGFQDVIKRLPNPNLYKEPYKGEYEAFLRDIDTEAIMTV